MKPIVADTIRFYYEEPNDALYLERCRAHLDILDLVTRTAASLGVEVEVESDPVAPAYKIWVSFGTFVQGFFVAEFDTEIVVSKLAKVFHLRHGFTVENCHDERVTPSLDGYGNTGYIKKQLRLHVALTRQLADSGYIELELADMEEIIAAMPSLGGIAGAHVRVEHVLFQDMRGLCARQ